MFPRLQEASSPKDFRDTFLSHVLLPLVVIASLTFLGGAILIRWAALSSDERSASHERHILDIAIGNTLRNISLQQRSGAEWGRLQKNLSNSDVDYTWLDENLGHWLHTMFSHDATYILDPDGNPVYAVSEEEHQTKNLFREVESSVEPLITRLRTGDNNPGYLKELILVNGHPAAVAAGQIDLAPEHAAIPSQQMILVSLMFLDREYLQALSKRIMLDGLVFESGDTAQDVTLGLPLRDYTNSTVGYLTWSPKQPGSEMIGKLVPLLIGFLVVITGIVTVMARRLWLSSLDLSQAWTELRASEAHSLHLARHDVLTGLPNRAMLDERLGAALAQVAHNHSQVALLVLDLDRFKQVNDTLGHHAGDSLIKGVAERLASIARDGDTVARIGGDEFMVIRTNVHHNCDVHELCERILEVIREPFSLLGKEVFTSASIGVALAPDDDTDRFELIRKADIALYAAKGKGRSCYRLFEQSMDDTVRVRDAIASDLKKALREQRDLCVFYQPEVKAKGGKVAGLEALVRWRHPTKGFISPDEFIPIAEETGLIIPLGEWVLREACRTTLRWPALYIAVNLSPVQFRSPDLAERIIEIVSAEGSDPGRIELEITESVLLEGEQAVHATLHTLRQAGFRIALDDFGTGYSSLSYLRRFPVDKIKIDRSFTQSLEDGSSAYAIVDSMVGLGRAMGLTITAEGVETPEQMNMLTSAGCDELQGYLFSRPLPEEALENAIAEVSQYGASA